MAGILWSGLRHLPQVRLRFRPHTVFGAAAARSVRHHLRPGDLGARRRGDRYSDRSPADSLVAVRADGLSLLGVVPGLVGLLALRRCSRCHPARLRQRLTRFFVYPDVGGLQRFGPAAAGDVVPVARSPSGGRDSGCVQGWRNRLVADLRGGSAGAGLLGTAAMVAGAGKAAGALKGGK